MVDPLPGLELERREPEAILEAGLAAGAPVLAKFCLLSGGSDSTVLAHRMRDHYDALLHVDTGTAVPGVREHVERLAKEVIRKPLLVYEAGNAYERMVLGDESHRLKSERQGWGLPGPGFHKLPYSRLKDRQFEKAVRDIKLRAGMFRRRASVALISGTRPDESARRMINANKEYSRRGSQLWIQPIVGWTNEEVREYREEHNLPISDPTALCHRSMECNCGAFKSPGEREMLISLWPKWWAETIGRLEEQAAERGLPCEWGERPRDWCRPGDEVAGPACAGCVQGQLDL